MEDKNLKKEELLKKWEANPEASADDIVLLPGAESTEEVIEEELYEDEELDEADENSYGQSYDLPESKDGFVDTATGDIIDRENLTPWEVIRAIAAQTNTVIHDPKPGCKHCYGRGYSGVDTITKSPVPCNCIYPNKTETEKIQESMYDNQRINGVINRSQRRKIKRAMKKQIINNRKMLRRREERGFYNPPGGTSGTDLDKDFTALDATASTSAVTTGTYTVGGQS